nr:matrix protein [Snakehead vesiculovirus]
MPLFKKSNKKSAVKPHQAPPPYSATALTPSAPMDLPDNDYGIKTMMVELDFKIISSIELKTIGKIYQIAQYMLDEYTGPIRSKPLYMGLFLASCHNAINPSMVHGKWHYEIQFRGPIGFNLANNTPLDWVCNPVAISYECNTPERSLVSYTCNMRPTKMTGSSFEKMFHGVLVHPSAASVFGIFQMAEAEVRGEDIVFILKDPGHSWH